MSIPVALPDLAEALERFGSGFLLTTAGERIKVVVVDPVVEGSSLRISDPGGGTRANLSANPQLTLTYAPLTPRDFALIIDGTGRVEGSDVVVTPTGAVLHRPASHASEPVSDGGCGQDCRPVTSSDLP
ncbi:MAG: pyridoxamine 5'-phosphate oxidase [Nocardioides sp.]|uniref:pyridoxamine 5'-phosphate oxidase n=1 Tax=Nocardioides sp. TaxID=35761 RepID=UPI003D6B1855